MASFQYGGPSSMGKPSFSSGGSRPDTMQVGNLTYTNMNSEDSLYGADGRYDPSRIFKGIDSMIGGGGGGSRPSYGGGGGLGGGGMTLGGGGPAGAYTGAINRGRSSGGVGGSIPTLTPRGAAETRAALAAAPYQYQMQAQGQQIAGQMDLAQLQGRIQLATAMAQIQAEREARMSLQIDNEKNRQLQLEMQRRNFGADDYQTRQQFNYQYGI